MERLQRTPARPKLVFSQKRKNQTKVESHPISTHNHVSRIIIQLYNSGGGSKNEEVPSLPALKGKQPEKPKGVIPIRNEMNPTASTSPPNLFRVEKNWREVNIDPKAQSSSMTPRFSIRRMLNRWSGSC